MPYSTIVNGEVLDWRFEQHPSMDYIYTFYIGNIMIGQLFKMGSMNWSAVYMGNNVLTNLRSAKGFRSRYAAAEFLLVIGGYQEQ